MHVGEAGNDIIRVDRIGARQLVLLLVGSLVLLCDGFDAQILTVTGSAISADWHFSKEAMGPIFALNLAGLMVGALAITPLTDLYSRKRIIVACVAVFGLLTLLTVLVANLWQLGALRLATGIALGAAMPSIIASASEYVPGRLRTRTVVGLSCAFSLGSALCGAAASLLIGPYGWTSIFWLGGLLPLATVPLVAAYMPESPTYLAAQGRLDELRAMLARIGPWLHVEPANAVRATRARFPVGSLFRQGRSYVTLCVWLTYFCSGATLYFLANWLPILVKSAGFGSEVSALSASSYQIGGITGGFLLGVLVDRFGIAALSAWLFAAAAGVALVGPASVSEPSILLAAFVAGALVVGGQNSMNAFIGGKLYPSDMRATGLGWALGVLRLGGILAGSLAAGVIVGLDLAPRDTFLIIAAPELLCGLGLLLIRLRAARTDASAPASAMA